MAVDAQEVRCGLQGGRGAPGPGDGQADREEVARELGIVRVVCKNRAAKDRRLREGGDGLWSEDERAELARLRKENAELAMRGGHVLKRSVALWVNEAMGR